MKNLLILAMAALNSVCSGADVTVYLSGQGTVPMLTLAQAEKMAASMFSGIGVRIRWARGKASTGKNGCQVPEDVSIEVRIAGRLRTMGQREELGRALPYAPGGTRVLIGYDPLLFDSRPGLLAHVLAHEIGHVLQGVGRHSETGIMKAHWERNERYDMERRTLSFSTHDAALIQAGIVDRLPAACGETLVAAR